MKKSIKKACAFALLATSAASIVGSGVVALVDNTSKSNNNAIHLYEKIGFIQTDVVDKEDCHEVNMILHKRAPV